MCSGLQPFAADRASLTARREEFTNQALGRLIHMKRPLPLLLVALAASLSAACASTPQPATERLAAEIVNSSSQNQRCASDEIASCRTTGTRISSRFAR